MGNSSSTNAFYGNTPLTPQDAPVVAVDARFCDPSATTKICLKDKKDTCRKLKFKDVDTGEVLFRTGNDAQLMTLLDAKKSPIVTLGALSSHLQSVYSAAGDGRQKLFEVYLKLGLPTEQSYEDTELRVDLTDATTGEKSAIMIEGEWRSRSAVFWLDRGASHSKEAVGKVHRSSLLLQSRYVLEVTANVDCALLLILCVLLDGALRKFRDEDNHQRPMKASKFK